MAYTQLSLIATPGKRYSFVAKTAVEGLVYGFKYNPFIGELDLCFKDLPEQTLVGKLTGGSMTALTPAQIMVLLSGEAVTTFDFNSQDLTSVGKIGIGVASPLANLHIVDNSASVRLQIIEQDGTGDASTQYVLTGLVNWIEGIDKSDSYKFKICTSNTLGTSDRFVIDINGNINIVAHNASTVGLKLGGTLVNNMLDQAASPTFTNLTLTGAISSAVKTITTSTDALDVAGVNTVFINPGAAVVIGGFANGVAGQRVDVIVVDADQNVTMEDEEATGTQKLRMHQSADETLNSERGGWAFVFDGTYWYDVSHARHV